MLLLKSKKKMEYEEAPSGFVTLYNYKEPFMKFQEGYGFQGVLLFDGKTEQVQCHLCGKCFNYLPNHINAVHQVRSNQYKELVGLRESTALMCEEVRAKFIAVGIANAERLRELGFKNIGEKVTSLSEEHKKKIADSLRRNKNRRESQNEHGTCPEQTLDKLRAQAAELGRTPMYHEIQNKNTIIALFGSIKKAILLAGLEPRKTGTYTRRVKKNKGYNITAEECLDFIRDFIEAHGRNPSRSDFRRRLMLYSMGVYIRLFGKWSRALELANSNISHYGRHG